MQWVDPEKLKVQGHFPMTQHVFQRGQWKEQEGKIHGCTEMPGDEGPAGNECPERLKLSVLCKYFTHRMT